jgi:hypothetical protein
MEAKLNRFCATFRENSNIDSESFELMKRLALKEHRQSSTPSLLHQYLIESDEMARQNQLIKRAEKKDADKLAAAINCAEKAKMKAAKMAADKLEIAKNLAERASYKRAEENERVAAAKEAADKLAAVTNCTERASLSKFDSKWEDMFEVLVRYIKETRETATRHMNDEQKAGWIWDGNVQFIYKTPCGKALGNWIDTQRKLKAKEKLKDDRELRLTSICLRWKMTGGGVPSP